MNIDTLKLTILERLLTIRNESVLTRIQQILDEYQQQELTQNHKRILDRRLERHKANPDAGSSWDDVRKRIEALG